MKNYPVKLALLALFALAAVQASGGQAQSQSQPQPKAEAQYQQPQAQPTEPPPHVDHEPNPADRALEAEREASKLDRTIEWLRGVLKEGPQEATVLFEEGKERGFSESTIRRAAASVGVTTDLKGYQSDRTSLWSLKQRIS
jgi:hypothetical protein